MHDSNQQLRLYRLLVENSLGLMCIHDMDGVLLAVNPAVGASMGYPPELAIGRNIREFLSPHAQPMFDAYLQRIRTHRTDSGLMRLVARDGSERVWSYRNICHEDPESPPLVLGHAVDITERIQAERALKEAQKALTIVRDDLAQRVAERTAELQQSNERLRAEMEQRKLVEDKLLQAGKLESLGVLAGRIAHDFNNLLTVVEGNIALAKAQTKPGDGLYALLQETSGACRRAALLASQLLTFSKGGAPIRRIGSIADLLRNSADLARAGSKLVINVAVPDDLWPAEFDAVQMGQVMQSILLNANEAMPEGGVIEVAAENTALGEAHHTLRPGKYIRISVRDHGYGVPPDILPRIFDPYFTTKETGTGLGLAIAYAIVTKHGGSIDVESTVGQGSKVSICLPAVEQIPEVQPAGQRTLDRRPDRILVMDDEASIRRLLMQALTRFGYEVESACEGEEAVALFKNAKESGRSFAAVLLDLTVPGGMGGKEAAAKLREIEPSVPVIVSSGYSNDPTLSEFRKHGFDDVLPKPWSPVQLREALERILGNSASA